MWKARYEWTEKTSKVEDDSLLSLWNDRYHDENEISMRSPVIETYIFGLVEAVGGITSSRLRAVEIMKLTGLVTANVVKTCPLT